MKTPLKKFLEAKDELLKDTLSDTTMDEFEKLSLIQEHRLFDTLSWIQQPFDCFLVEYREQLKNSHPDVQIYRIDDILNEPGWRNRGEIVYIANFIEGLYDEEDDEVSVLMAGKGLPDYKMKRSDVIKHLYNWCIQNKACGYSYDW
jgi:hypothetical protein